MFTAATSAVLFSGYRDKLDEERESINVLLEKLKEQQAYFALTGEIYIDECLFLPAPPKGISSTVLPPIRELFGPEERLMESAKLKNA